MGDSSEDVAPNTLLDMADFKFKEWLKEKRLKQEREKEMRQIEEQKRQLQQREQQEKEQQIEKQQQQQQQQQKGKVAAGADPRQRTQSFGNTLAEFE
ncbi:hypothetical protein P167DRAFT_540781 [Morchella conica CCBAS932]|uniref:Uncharacterized protein n=1 Tax=Morchella conica CCBAS932 TaxID=1392247 RepID=A0A3N4KKY6_9PEZI|nr:hypothetical protein P167DRAFT_540781 [Morchella conica CCBAS932]